MANRRATTDYSLVVGVDKPAGMTSHDVVERCRRIYGERRCGHAGTLDPAATGVLVVCVGPATRLDRFFTGHRKSYDFTIVFGSATDTDDAQGIVTRREPVPQQLADIAFARAHVRGLVGRGMQLPPVYSAVKVNGRKSYEAARRGRIIELKPRPVEIFEAELLDCACADDQIVWKVSAQVSAGTYVRSIARDVGRTLGTVAHVGELRRTSAGNVGVLDCVSLEALEADPFGNLLDPVKMLGMRFAFVDDSLRKLVEAGAALPPRGLSLHAFDVRVGPQAFCGCTSGVRQAPGDLVEGEQVAIVDGSVLAAIYEYSDGALRCACKFSRGVRRVGDI